MPRTIARYAAALLAGLFIVAANPWLVAGIAALPGLRALIDGIRGTGLPVAIVYPLITHYLPGFLLAFAVGLAVFKLLRGHRGRLLAALLLPWLAMSGDAYLSACVGTDVSCFGAHPFHEFAGMLNVPLGLALASFVGRAPGASSPSNGTSAYGGNAARNPG
jgi:hypothetical protein